VLVPTLRFFAASSTPNSMQIAVDGKPYGAPMPCTKQPAEPMAQITAAAENLAAIQDRLQDPFPVPALDPQLADRISRLRRLIEGALVPWARATLTANLDPETVPEFLADIGTANRFAFAADGPNLSVDLGGTSVDVGPYRYYAAEAEIVDIEALRDVRPTDAAPSAVVRPLGDGYVYAQLLRSPPPAGWRFYRAAPGTPLTEPPEADAT
jgi:hypothetical protein